MGGRSACDGCGARVRPRDLVPVLSFLLLGGRCRRCHAPIDRRHLWIELAAALVGASALLAQPEPAGLLLALGGWILLTLGALDLDALWLPDRLTLPLALLALVHGWLLEHGPPLEPLVGLCVAFLALEAVRRCYRALRRRDGLGAGDPKLAGAIGAWIGWSALPMLLLLAAGGGLVAVAFLRLAGREVPGELPFGTMLALAAWPLMLMHAAS
jgi:leader peptidase (prepilin peptidase)/N-methyltransferase